MPRANNYDDRFIACGRDKVLKIYLKNFESRRDRHRWRGYRIMSVHSVSWGKRSDLDKTAAHYDPNITVTNKPIVHYEHVVTK